MNSAENHISNVTEYMQAVGERARAASRLINRASTAQKNEALLAIADSLDVRRDQLIMANQEDLEAGRGKDAHGLVRSPESIWGPLKWVKMWGVRISGCRGGGLPGLSVGPIVGLSYRVCAGQRVSALYARLLY